ncbi:hypothetical protein SAMN05421664_3092 [Chryseobacterium soldanellicola]|uniref:MerC mercury resistance protein n=1 Tax=Chryseobacterium soldanellicola TaxID=311333 RepID=A0A1H1FJ35_9FLAO|nr:hypothetical protein SAMN05421664_3092 [Chryseobacterium soldanellicola]
MKTKILDYIGLSAATLCLIHCIVFPLLLIVPLGILHNPLVDLLFLLVGGWVVFRITKEISVIWLKFLF